MLRGGGEGELNTLNEISLYVRLVIHRLTQLRRAARRSMNVNQS